MGTNSSQNAAADSQNDVRVQCFSPVAASRMYVESAFLQDNVLAEYNCRVERLRLLAFPQDHRR